MTSAVKEIKRSLNDAAQIGGLGLLGIQDEDASPDDPAADVDASLSDSEKATLASEEAARAAKKKKQGTQTVLTNPLGGGTASTATATLGGK